MPITNEQHELAREYCEMGTTLSEWNLQILIFLAQRNMLRELNEEVIAKWRTDPRSYLRVFAKSGMTRPEFAADAGISMSALKFNIDLARKGAFGDHLKNLLATECHDIAPPSNRLMHCVELLLFLANN